MYPQTETIKEMFQSKSSFVDFSQIKIDTSMFDLVCFKSNVAGSWIFPSIGAKTAEKKWIPAFPPLSAIFINSHYTFAGIVLPTGYEEMRNDEELYLYHGIITIDINGSNPIALVDMQLEDEFNADELMDAIIAAKKRVGNIFHIDTSMGAFYFGKW